VLKTEGIVGPGTGWIRLVDTWSPVLARSRSHSVRKNKLTGHSWLLSDILLKLTSISSCQDSEYMRELRCAFMNYIDIWRTFIDGGPVILSSSASFLPLLHIANPVTTRWCEDSTNRITGRIERVRWRDQDLDRAHAWQYDKGHTLDTNIPRNTNLMLDLWLSQHLFLCSMHDILSSLEASSARDIFRVAVISAGPSRLGILKYLLIAQ
jgi:hypothetical protein